MFIKRFTQTFLKFERKRRNAKIKVKLYLNLPLLTTIQSYYHTVH